MGSCKILFVKTFYDVVLENQWKLIISLNSMKILKKTQRENFTKN